MPTPEARLARLTSRQRQVLEVACERGSVKEAAHLLGIAYATAKNTVMAAYARLDVPGLPPACLLIGLASADHDERVERARRVAARIEGCRQRQRTAGRTA